MIAIYARVSDRKSQKHAAQVHELKAWMKANKLTNDDVTWFLDKESGTIITRDGMDRLQAEVAAGRVKQVVVWSLDRIARTVIDGNITLAGWIRAEVRVVITAMELDLKGPVGQMIASILFGVAEIELVRQKERQAAGIAAARKRGVYGHGKGRPKGSTKASPARAKELADQGLKKTEIARALGVSRDTVYEYLKQAG